MTETLYVYGTLRPGKGETTLVPGTLYDLGWFPGIILTRCDKVEDRVSCDYCGYPQSEAAGSGDSRGPCTAQTGPHVICEKITVEDWGPVDRYEGYNPDHPETSLYIRRPHLDGWIYEYNQQYQNRPVVESGDWLSYMQEKKAWKSQKRA